MSEDIIYATSDFHVVACLDDDCQSPLTNWEPGFEWDFQVNRYISMTSDNFPGTKHPDYWIFPVYGYAHSDITLSLQPFSCPWDSGVAGVVAVKRPSRGGEWRTRKAFLAYLESLIDTLNDYLLGNCWGYEVIDSSTDESVDSCWGYIGDHDTSGLFESAKASCDHYQTHQPE